MKKNILNEQVSRMRAMMGLNEFFSMPTGESPESGAIQEDEKAKYAKTIAMIDKIGSRPVAMKMVDGYLSKMIGLTASDLADTATYANGLDSIEELLDDEKYSQAYAEAKETAKAMIEDEGFGGMFDEELKGKQHKIDANHNGKIDADDFKLLRKDEALHGDQDKIDANHNGKIDADDFKMLRKQKCNECGVGYMEEGKCDECGYMEEVFNIADLLAGDGHKYDNNGGGLPDVNHKVIKNIINVIEKRHRMGKGGVTPADVYEMLNNDEELPNNTTIELLLKKLAEKGLLFYGQNNKNKIDPKDASKYVNTDLSGKSSFHNVATDKRIPEPHMNESYIMEKKDIIKKFQQQYGKKKGEKIYYATANKQDRNPETFKQKDEESVNEFLDFGSNNVTTNSNNSDSFNNKDSFNTTTYNQKDDTPTGTTQEPIEEIFAMKSESKKWIKTDPSKKGMFKGRSLESLKAELEKLKKTTNKTEALKKKEHELMFAIRAKKGHGFEN
jgi:hypothetical protein